MYIYIYIMCVGIYVCLDVGLNWIVWSVHSMFEENTFRTKQKHMEQIYKSTTENLQLPTTNNWTQLFQDAPMQDGCESDKVAAGRLTVGVLNKGWHLCVTTLQGSQAKTLPAFSSRWSPDKLLDHKLHPNKNYISTPHTRASHRQSNAGKSTPMTTFCWECNETAKLLNRWVEVK